MESTKQLEKYIALYALLWHKRTRKLVKGINSVMLAVICMGIILGIMVGTGSYLLLALSCVSLFLFFLSSKSRIMFVIFLAISILYAIHWESTFQDDIKRVTGKNEQLLAVVDEEAEAKEYSQKVVLRIEKLNGRVLASLPKYPSLKVGDVITFTTALEVPQNFTNDFDYRAYLKSNRVFFLANAKEFEVVSKQHSLLTKLALEVRRFINETINTNLNEPEASLLSGILIGNKTNFNENFEQNLRRSGASHIVSVSGFNVSIIFILIMSLSGFLNRKFLLLTSAMTILLYCLIVGMGNLPAQRAGLMIFFVILASLSGRRNNIVAALFLSLAIILFEYPFYIKNVSLQLSFAATIGLFVFSGHIRTYLERINLLATVSDVLATTIGVIIATLPLTIVYFGEISLVSLITNLLILPVIGLIMFISLVGFGVSFIGFKYLTLAVFKISSILLEYCGEIINTFGRLPFATSNEKWVIFLFYFFFLLLVVLIDIRNFSKKVKNE